MAVNPMLTAGANGIQNGMRGLSETAQDIAELGVESVNSATDARGAATDNLSDIAEAMVDLKLYERQVQASAKVVQTADEVLGFLLGAN